ncbi:MULTISPECIES: cytochrome P450 family protein [Streptomyces]|uniref:cytochrome P450 family protein n=1 Tax=Streptomyces TaxID=1883 RepID=UPI000F54E99A|nr:MULTISPECIES: cytochrome P450 [unclassified Streptomyces]WSU34977.1 cytochrome P450 [Streptomyces gougerotii]MBL3803665.1 cytochrome P450 [Streptomyces sp. BRB081]MDQ0292670.1 cytochrome P450 [Streptomyces sp. DSM 41037]RPK87421.1 Cytochrome P450 107B1 [Streptomyces sp. ADI98-12]WPR53926.1 cytochrome P450 [Streptomyces sp. S399]
MTDVVDLAAYGEPFTADPYPVYAELRERGPVHRVRVPGAGGPVEAWLVVGYEQAREALADPRLSKDPTTLGVEIPEGELIGRHMLVADPPEHTRLRRLVAREFTGRRVQSLAPLVRRITDELLDAMVPRGRADLVQSFAFPLPLTVISELLGVPVADRAAFRRMSSEVVAPSGQVPAEANLAALGTFLDALIEEKRRSGTTGDLISDLIRTADDDGDQLSSSELRAMAYLLLIAGHETTVNLIAGGVHTLLRHPEQLAALRADPTLIDGAVEEILRYEGPIETATWRHTTEPVEIGGVRLAEGEPVLVSLASAGHDPARFPDPERFDIRRRTQGHLAFGHGLHFCLGAPLARLEGRIALDSLLERCPDLAPDGEPSGWAPGLLIRGVTDLPLRW